MTHDKLKCSKCGRMLADIQFYTKRGGEKLDMCKRCLTMHVDMFDDSTYLWLLEKVDVPYVPTEWAATINKEVAAKGAKATAAVVFGKYLAKMKLSQFKKYGYADSAAACEAVGVKLGEKAEETKIKDAYYQEQYEQGNISEAEYRTLASSENQYNKLYDAATADYIGEHNQYDESKFLDESEIPDPGEQLTKEDKLYLAMKWGRLYNAGEWVELERMYREMVTAFEIEDPDSRNTVMLLCKTTLKANQAID